MLTFSGPSASPDGDAPTYPATVTFSAGIGVVSVTLVAAESAVLTVSDGTRNGTAPVIVAAAASNRLTFTRVAHAVVFERERHRRLPWLLHVEGDGGGDVWQSC